MFFLGEKRRGNSNSCHGNSGKSSEAHVDVVQHRLERMLNELEDLERRGLFSLREIADIVYRLKRPSSLKEDFLAYIEYEKKLDELRLLRKNAFLKRQTGKNRKWKKSVSDFAGTARIVDVYRMAATRFILRCID